MSPLHRLDFGTPHGYTKPPFGLQKSTESLDSCGKDGVSLPLRHLVCLSHAFLHGPRRTAVFRGAAAHEPHLRRALPVTYSAKAWPFLCPGFRWFGSAREAVPPAVRWRGI